MFGRNEMPDPDPELLQQARQLHLESPLTDIHAHPGLKAYLLLKDLWGEPEGGARFNPFSLRASFKGLLEGRVGVVWSSAYVPEQELFDDFPGLKTMARLGSPLYPVYRQGHYWQHLQEMFVGEEYEVRQQQHRGRVVYAQNPEDVRRGGARGKLVIVRTVEGSHVLEGRLERLEKLHRQGVAMLTPFHLYANKVGKPVDAVPEYPLVKKLSSFKVGQGPPLTGWGEALIDKMNELGMLIDLCHGQPEARRQILRRTPDRPVVASHIGVRGLYDTPYNLSDEEILAIHERGGLIGIIFMPYWLTGPDMDDGMEAIWKTARYIRELTGSWDSVALGTDFDGFTEPPREIVNATQIERLTALLLERGLQPENVRKILGQNALRVLQEGWKPAETQPSEQEHE